MIIDLEVITPVNEKLWEMHWPFQKSKSHRNTRQRYLLENPFLACLAAEVLRRTQTWTGSAHMKYDHCYSLLYICTCHEIEICENFWCEAFWSSTKFNPTKISNTPYVYYKPTHTTVKSSRGCSISSGQCNSYQSAVRQYIVGYKVTFYVPEVVTLFYTSGDGGLLKYWRGLCG